MLAFKAHSVIVLPGLGYPRRAVRAGALAIACGLPWAASAQMAVYWPSSGGATTSLGQLSDTQALVLTNMNWHGEDAGIRSHLDLATPVPQLADAGYAVSSITSSGFDVTVDASVLRGVSEGQSAEVVPGKAGAGIGVYFELAAATDVRIHGVSGSEFGLMSTLGYGTQNTTLSLMHFTTINGASKEFTVWSATDGALQADALLHLNAGVYQLQAATSVDLFANGPRGYLPGMEASLQVNVSAVPEPGLAWLWGMGLIGVAAAARQGRVKRQG